MELRRTLLFTDLVDSVAIWEESPDDAHAVIVALQKIIAEKVSEHAGRVASFMGDGAFAVFSEAHDAVHAAVDIQRVVTAMSPIRVGRIQLRIGIHTGLCRSFQGDVIGIPVNLAARLESVAHGGQIVVSDATADVCAGHLPAGIHFRLLGAYRLRGVANPVVAHSVLATGLPSEFPPLRTSARGLEGVPEEVTPLIGRDDLVEQVGQTIAIHSLTTLWGPGGAGKTRVAVRVARQARRPFVDGVDFIDLSQAPNEESVLEMAMRSLGAQPVRGEKPLEAITRVLSPVRLLLVLDNVEHVVEPSRRLIRALRRRCQSVHVLATSREPLDLEDEQLVKVPPLPVPQDDAGPEALAQISSVQLFVERAQRAESEFRLDGATAHGVARVCRHADGLPLALELAAARLTIEDLAEVAEGGERALRFQRYGVSDRQASLAGSVEWSLRCLSSEEADLLGALATFAGPFTRDMAVAIGEGDQHIILDALDQLVRRAVVVQAEPGRQKVLVPCRDYARMGLDTVSRDRLHQRHAELMLRRAPELGRAYKTSSQQAACESMRAELSDYREAMRWLIDHDRVDDAAILLVSLFQFAFNQAIAEIHEWALQVAALIPESHPLASDVLGAAAMARWSRAELDAAIETGERAVARAEANGRGGTIWARIALQNSLGYSGRISELGPHFAAQVRECKRSPDIYWQVSGLGFEALSMIMSGRPEEAREKVDAALALARHLGNPDCLHWSLYCLGRLLEPSDPVGASAAFEEAMSAARAVDNRFYLSLGLVEWIALRRRLGDLAGALVGQLELLEILHSFGNESQLAQLYTEVAQVLADGGLVTTGALVYLAARGRPQMPRDLAGQAPSQALEEQLRGMAPEEWSTLEVKAAATSDADLVNLVRAGLEKLLAQVVA